MFIKARLISELKKVIQDENAKSYDIPVDWEFVHGLNDLIIDLERTLDSGTEIGDYFELVRAIRTYYYSEKYDKPVQAVLDRLSKIWLL